MRNSTKITRKYQFGYMLLRHLAAVGVAAILQAIAFWYFLEKPIMRYIVATVFAVIYGMMLYSSARRLSVYDKKPYTPLQPDAKYGLLWGIMISSTILLFIIIYKLNWLLFSVDGIINNWVSIVVNALFYLWVSPYFGFMSEGGGGIPIYAVIIMLIIPIAACYLGYIAGNRNFDILQKLQNMTFEDDEE